MEDCFKKGKRQKAEGKSEEKKKEEEVIKEVIEESEVNDNK